MSLEFLRPFDGFVLEVVTNATALRAQSAEKFVATENGYDLSSARYSRVMAAVAVAITRIRD